MDSSTGVDIKKQKEIQAVEEEVEELKHCLPRASFMGSKIGDAMSLIKYQGFWCLDHHLESMVKLQRFYQARETDIIISGIPKTGTTWLRSLVFATLNRLKHRTNANNEQHPFFSHHPNELIINLEIMAFDSHNSTHVDEYPSPRLFGTHMPYASLPESIKASKCRIIHMSRNPLDTAVSSWYFAYSNMKVREGEGYKPPPFEDFFEDFYQGRFVFGPFFEQVVAYWELSLKHPDKVMFVKYEDFQDDTRSHLMELAEFIGMPFSPQEESQGVVEEIIDLCSIKTFKERKVNKSGMVSKGLQKSSYFREGMVGDWTNHFTSAMYEKMKNLMDQKLEGTGLSFKLLP